MADFFFFTDLDLLQNQNAGDEFGQINAATFNYRSKHTATLSATINPSFNFLDLGPTAYAVCSGNVLVIGGEDSTTLDVILKPSDQKNNGFPAIKYIVYHGILKSSYFSTNGSGTDLATITSDITTIDDPFTNDLRRKVYKDSPAAVTIAALGMKKTKVSYNTDTLIDTLFASGNYGPYVMNGGESLGKFSNGDFGITIIADSLNHNPTLHYLFNNYQPKLLTTTSGDAGVINHVKRINNEIKCAFIDPCAFFGNSAKTFLRARKFIDPIDPNTSPNFPGSPGMPVYSQYKNPGTGTGDLYDDIIKKFVNRNKIYIDIRNPENNSINYSQNYSDTIYIKLGAAAPQPADYYSTDFPILILNGYVNAGTPENLVQIYLPEGGVEAVTTTDINTGLPTNYNYINNPSPTVFHTIINGNQLATFLFDADFKRTGTDVPNYSSAIKLSFSNFGSNNTVPISDYIRLQLLKTPDSKPEIGSSTTQTLQYFDVPVPEHRTLYTLDHLDNVFTPFRLLLPNKMSPVGQNSLPTDKTSCYVYNEDLLIDSCLSGMSGPYIAQVGIAEDADANGYVTLFSLPNYTKYQNPYESPLKLPISSGNSNIDEADARLSFIKLVNKLNKKTTLYRRASIVGANVRPVLGNDFEADLFYEDPSTDPNDKNNSKLCSMNWLSIPKSIWNKLVEINNSTTQSPTASVTDPYNLNSPFTADFIDPSRTYLGLKLHAKDGASYEYYDENNVLISATDFFPYFSYEIYLSGEVSDGNGGIKYKTIRTGLFQYTFRKFSFELKNFNKRSFDGAGYTISGGAGIKHIETTLYLMRHPSMTPKEFFDSTEHFKESIRQLWNNNPAKNSGYMNNGITAPFQIDADNVVFKYTEECERAFHLRNKEVSILFVKPASGEPNRSFIDGQARNGIMFFEPLVLYRAPGTGAFLPTTRYVDTGFRNTPGHEFGHMLSIKDRYTYVVKFNPKYQMIAGYSVNCPGFMQKLDYFHDNPPVSTPPAPKAIDEDYITDYNWIVNLYTNSMSVYENPNTNKPIMPFLPNYDNETEFQTIYSGRMPVSVGNTDVPERFKKVWSGITATQVESVTRNAGQYTRIGNQWESDYYDNSYAANVSSFFNLRHFVFFKLNTTNPADTSTVSDPSSDFQGVFVGLFFTPPFPPKYFPNQASDDGFVLYTPPNQADNKEMNQRIWNHAAGAGHVPADPLLDVFKGYFSPFYVRDWDNPSRVIPESKKDERDVNGKNIFVWPDNITSSPNAEAIKKIKEIDLLNRLPFSFMSNPSELEDLKYGGLVSLKKALDMVEVKKLDIEEVKLIFNYDTAKRWFDIRGLNAKYRDIGYSDRNIFNNQPSVGRRIWNTPSDKNKSETYKGQIIKYDIHSNREQIVKLM